jgi:hypothetical protein
MGGILSRPKTPKVPKVDIQGDIGKYVSGYKKALPDVLAAERQYRPEFLGLNLADVNTFLRGNGDQMGLFGLGQMAQQSAGQNILEARQQELQSMLGQAPAFRQFAQTLSPESQAQVDAAKAEAARATQSAQGLTPQEQRMAEQGARESFAARGMLDSRGSIAGEVLNRENVLAQKRQEAAGARNNAFGMAQDFYTTPGFNLLSNIPQTYNAGLQQVQMGLGAIGSATPQMINPDVGVNVGMAQRANQTQASAAGASAKASWGAGIMGGLGSAFGGFMSSDVRLKENIKRVGTSKQGFGIYSYNYIGDNQKYRGVMAQEVQASMPEAVTEIGGYLAVDYSMIQ